MKSLQQENVQVVRVGLFNRDGVHVKSFHIHPQSGSTSEHFHRMRRHPMGGTAERPLTEAGSRRLTERLIERSAYVYVKRWPVWGKDRKGVKVLRGYTVWVGRAAA